MFGNFSRYCEYVRSPDTLLAPEECRDFLLDFAARCDEKPLLFPSRDHDLQFIAKYYQQLKERYSIIAASPEMLQKILNKAAFYSVADKLGLPYPATAWINCGADIEQVERTLTFPVIAKPVYSAQWRKKEMWELVGRQKALVIESYDALKTF
jgi:D-aspartate ligase